MAVDSLRETRHINRVNTRDLSVLWSAQSYRPEITEALRTIRSMTWRPLAELCTNAIGPGPHPTFTSAGHPCLKTKNILGVVVDASEVDFVAYSDVKRWPHYCIGREDLALNVTGAGSIGRVGMYFGEDRPLTNQHLARLSIAPGTDAGFVCAYLSSWWGERALEQGISGSTGQLNLVNDHIRRVPVPVPDLAAQRYIGDKIRQAERLRERARSLRRRLTKLLTLPELVAALRAEDQRANRVSSSELTARLDAKYYGTRATTVLRAAGVGSIEVGRLVVEVSNGFEHRDFDAEGTPYITVTEVSDGRLVLATAPKLGSGVLIPDKARIDTRCALVVRTGSVGVAVPVFEEDTQAVISSHLIRLKFASEREAAVVAAFLNSDAGRVLQRKISYGAVQPQIGQEELLALPLPRALVDRSESILHALKTEDAALRAAARLATAAKLLVEDLINAWTKGRPKEDEFVAAHKALEAGDVGADRTILSKLRENRASDAKRLIPDLDALCELLGESDRESDG